MRRTIKDKFSGSSDRDHRQMTDRFLGFVKEKSNDLVSTVQEHVTSVADTTGTLAKQKIFNTLFSTGVVKSEDIRIALQLGIGFFLEQYSMYGKTEPLYIQRQKFPAAGGITPPHNLTDFDIETHGLNKFVDLMQIYGIDCQRLKQHLCHGALREIINPSSSGSLLYLTADSLYLIKTIRDYDVKFIQQKFLDEYSQHFHRQSDSYLAKLFGIYGYVPYISQQRGISADAFTLRFAVFANFIPKSIDIHEKYDLKGSSYRRDAAIGERLKKSATLKDNDFRDLHPSGFKLARELYTHLKEILIRDVDFLEKLNIMDYSLLLTIHNIDNPVPVKRTGCLEALMGTVRDTMLIVMNEQQAEIDQKIKELTPNRPVLNYQSLSKHIGFQPEHVRTCDMNIAKQYGAIPAMNEKGERVLLFIGIIDIFQTFDICKVMQRQYQTVENRDVVAERSIVETDFYAQRFKEFLFNSVFHPMDEEPTAGDTYISLYPKLSQ